MDWQALDTPAKRYYAVMVAGKTLINRTGATVYMENGVPLIQDARLMPPRPLGELLHSNFKWQVYTPEPEPLTLESLELKMRPLQITEPDGGGNRIVAPYSRDEWPYIAHAIARRDAGADWKVEAVE